MAGIGRGKQGKSVEEFLRSQNYEPVQAQGTETYERAGARKPGRGLSAPTIVAAVLLLLCFVSFARIHCLDREVTSLRGQPDKKMFDDIRGEVAALNAKLEKSGGEVEKLKGDIARVQTDMQAISAASAHKAKDDVQKKRPVDKKKTMKEKRRQT